jgi:hypothetical protein
VTQERHEIRDVCSGTANAAEYKIGEVAPLRQGFHLLVKIDSPAHQGAAYGKHLEAFPLAFGALTESVKPAHGRLEKSPVDGIEAVEGRDACEKKDGQYGRDNKP